MADFTPIPALVGGALIGLAASILLIANGKVAGISGILAGLLGRAELQWRGWFVGGLLLAGVLALFAPASIGSSPRSLPVLAVAGLLVGVGTRLGGGCTSGHGVCGISRLSARSIAATVVFVALGMFVVRAFAWLGGLS
jgi:uncharacterized membrane protein YedE/YeeE